MWNFTAIAFTFLIACCLSAGAAATPSTVTGEGGTIYFSVVVSNAPATLNSSGVLSAVDRAIQLINNDPTILPRHHLQRSLLSTQVSDTEHNNFVTCHPWIRYIGACTCFTQDGIIDDGMHLRYTGDAIIIHAM